MTIETDETKIAGMAAVMPWDKSTFLEVRARKAVEGVEYTPTEFKTEFYDTRKLAKPSVDLPEMRGVTLEQADILAEKISDAITEGKTLNVSEMLADAVLDTKAEINPTPIKGE